MQSGSGKSTVLTLIRVTLMATTVTLLVFLAKPTTSAKVVALFFSLEGTILLAYGFSASGQVPAQGTLRQRISWFFKTQGAVPLHYNRPLYFGGLLLLGVSFVISTLLGCDSGERKNLTTKPLTPEQIATNQCLEKVMKKKIEFMASLAEREVYLMTSGQSTVALILIRRRQEEQFCAAEARCLAQEEPIYSTLFSSCLSKKAE